MLQWLFQRRVFQTLFVLMASLLLCGITAVILRRTLLESRDAFDETSALRVTPGMTDIEVEITIGCPAGTYCLFENEVPLEVSMFKGSAAAKGEPQRMKRYDDYYKCWIGRRGMITVKFCSNRVLESTYIQYETENGLLQWLRALFMVK